MRAFLLLLPALALLGASLGGCYLSHERPGRFDAGADASVPRDTPILLGIHRPLGEILSLLSGTPQR